MIFYNDLPAEGVLSYVGTSTLGTATTYGSVPVKSYIDNPYGTELEYVVKPAVDATVCMRGIIPMIP